jgi:hypothetical protein
VRSIDEHDRRLTECLDIARKVVTGTVRDPTRGSDHYYADSMRFPPKWAYRAPRPW